MEDLGLTTITAHVEKLGLGDKELIRENDLLALRSSLRAAGEIDLADWADGLESPEELEDFIVNTIYG